MMNRMLAKKAANLIYSKNAMQITARFVCTKPICGTKAPLASTGGRQGEAATSWQMLGSRLSSSISNGKKTQKLPRSTSGVTGGGGGSTGAGGFGGGAGGSGGGGGGARGGPFGLWGAYLSALDSNPILTKTITSAVLNALGDVLSQVFFEDGDGFDWKRTFIFGILGFVLVGPALHYWYGTLAKVITQGGTTGAVLRLIADQGIFAPAFIGVFFSALFLLEGHPQDIQAKLKQDWKGAVAANWKLWIPFQFLNFRFVPQHLQVLAANVVAVGWNTYLSWASHRAVPLINV